MELNPGEALENNVLGTRMAPEATDQCGVERFVLISTGKAVNPSSVMGATMRGPPRRTGYPQPNWNAPSRSPVWECLG